MDKERMKRLMQDKYFLRLIRADEAGEAAEMEET